MKLDLIYVLVNQHKYLLQNWLEFHLACQVLLSCSKVQYLRQNLDEQNLARLSEICYRKNFAKKDAIFFEGEPGQAIYFCVKGNIQLFRTHPDGRETVVKTIKSGEAFAEVILFEKDKYPVSAVALRPSDLLIIPKRQFNDLLKDEDFRDAFIAMLIRKQRYLVNKIQMLS